MSLLGFKSFEDSNSTGLQLKTMLQLFQHSAAPDALEVYEPRKISNLLGWWLNERSICVRYRSGLWGFRQTQFFSSESFQACLLTHNEVNNSCTVLEEDKVKFGISCAAAEKTPFD